MASLSLSLSHLHQACLNKLLKCGYSLLSPFMTLLVPFFWACGLKLLISWWTACLSLNAVFNKLPTCFLSLAPVYSFCILKLYLKAAYYPPTRNANTCNFSPGLKILFRSVVNILIWEFWESCAYVQGFMTLNTRKHLRINITQRLRCSQKMSPWLNGHFLYAIQSTELTELAFFKKISQQPQTFESCCIK